MAKTPHFYILLFIDVIAFWGFNVVEVIFNLETNEVIRERERQSRFLPVLGVVAFVR